MGQPCRYRHVPTREAAVVIGGRDESPAFSGLTPDEGLAGFALGVERVEVLLKALFR
jgi:hypothetical protein